MDSRQLDHLLNELEGLLGPRHIGPLSDAIINTMFESNAVRHDYRPFWNKAKNVQVAFKAVHHPSRQEQENAWARFNDLRSEARRRHDYEKNQFLNKSKDLKDQIMDKLSGRTWSPITDSIFFFDQTTADQIKRWGSYTKEAGQLLSQHKHEMTREHKQICFEKIQEVRDSHQRFWDGRSQAYEARKRERHDTFITKVQANINRNSEKLVKAVEALRRCKCHAIDLQEKLREAKSENFRDVVEGWIEENSDKRADIQTHIQRLESWIDEDTRKLGSVY